MSVCTVCKILLDAEFNNEQKPNIANAIACVAHTPLLFLLGGHCSSQEEEATVTRYSSDGSKVTPSSSGGACLWSIHNAALCSCLLWPEETGSRPASPAFHPPPPSVY